MNEIDNAIRYFMEIIKDCENAISIVTKYALKISEYEKEEIDALRTHADESRMLVSWLKELKDYNDHRWIPMTKRKMTDEDDVIFECELPEDNQEVIVSYGDNVRTDIFCIEDGGYHFDCVDIRKVQAWMPLPEPYKAEIK